MNCGCYELAQFNCNWLSLYGIKWNIALKFVDLNLYLLITAMFLWWQVRPDLGRIEKWILRNAFDDEHNLYLPKVWNIMTSLHLPPLWQSSLIQTTLLHVLFIYFFSYIPIHTVSYFGLEYPSHFYASLKGLLKLSSFFFFSSGFSTYCTGRRNSSVMVLVTVGLTAWRIMQTNKYILFKLWRISSSHPCPVF